MIVVRVELWSARTGERTELARMRISNVGGGGNARNYAGETFRGRDAATLDQGQITRRGRLDRFPAESLHVWNLVARMLAGMGYR